MGKNWTPALYPPKLLYLLVVLCILLYTWRYGNQTFFSGVGAPPRSVPSVLSFEDPSELAYFKYPPSSRLSISSRHYKDGYHSLLWQWEPGDKLALPLGRYICNKSSGIGIWIYRNESSKSNLTITLSDTTQKVAILRFNFSLSYKGWRVAWATLKEAATKPKHPRFNYVEIQAPSYQALATDPTQVDVCTKVVFIDLLYFLRAFYKLSRDKIVPPISNNSVYPITSFWQQTYKWEQIVPPAVDETTPLTEHEKGLLRNVSLINKRLLNWFANESFGPSHYRGNVRKRWYSLVVLGFQQARTLHAKLNITLSATGGVLTGSPLFARNSIFGNSTKIGGNRKLGLVTNEILLPLALEYYFSTKPQNMEQQISEELKHLNSPLVKERSASIQRIAKGDEEYSQLLRDELQPFRKMVITESGLQNVSKNIDMKKYSLEELKNALKKMNKKKLDVLMQLLEYLTDQGWSDGSALGSLDHQMNKAGDFMHALFLLKPDLLAKDRLDPLVRTMRWYNDMGEIYQSHFEYNGTSADRMRTIILYRLETILMNPVRTIKAKREQLRDMAAYVRWCDNALLVNKALDTVFKPDLSSFHHWGVYGSAYTPSALTIAATVYYLLDGTAFVLSSTSRQNIRARLDIYTKMAVLYSLPNSINGRFPNYQKKILVRMLSAYALLSSAPQYYLVPDNSTALQCISLGEDLDMVRIFLRLYRPNDPSVKQYLADGNPQSITTQSYLDTIGSLQIMEAVYRQARKAGLKAKEPPTGHWVMNYGPLSVHRRRGWVVTVKGFSRYAWDYETSPTENLYGLYQSYGALQISTSEADLAAYDVAHGWDWARVPGTTSIRMDLNQMRRNRTNRGYQPSKFVGGVLLVSKDQKLANGVFAMRFRQPRGYDPGSYVSKLNFTFSKSVFFYNDLIVCIGSDINVTGSEPNRTETTLFQNMILKPSSTSAIYVNGKTKWLTQDLRMRIQNESSAILDTLGNGYFVPAGSRLNVEISLQESRTDSGLEPSSARYATTWLDHGVNPLTEQYEYAVLVDTDTAGIEDLRAAQGSQSPRYVVLEQSLKAHVVKFNGDQNTSVYGYSFFSHHASTISRDTSGPVEHVSHACVVMAEIDDAPHFSNLNLSISSPDLNFDDSKLPHSVYTAFYMRSIPIDITVYLRYTVRDAVQRVLVNGRAVPSSQFAEYVEVVGKGNSTKPEGFAVLFKKLAHGDSIEAYLVR